MRTRPVCTLVAEIKICRSALARSASKSTNRSNKSLSGLILSGLTSYGEKHRDSASNQACTGVPSSGVNDNSRSITARCKAARLPLVEAARQKSASRFCASSRPPRVRPSASITAFTAPADVPEMPSMTSRSSHSNCSSTPQVKAPWAPPPCSARLMRFGFGTAFCSGARPGTSDESIFIMQSPGSRSLRGPAAVDREIGAGNRLRHVGAKIDGEARHLLDGDEFLGRLRRQYHVALDLFFGYAARFRRIRYLLLDQRRPNIAGADAVTGHAEGGELERDGLGQTGDAVLGGDIGGLERRSDQRMGRGGRDDAAPFARLHAGHRGADGVEGGRQIDGDDLIPFVDRKVFDRRDELDARIVHQDV